MAVMDASATRVDIKTRYSRRISSYLAWKNNDTDFRVRAAVSLLAVSGLCNVAKIGHLCMR